MRCTRSSGVSPRSAAIAPKHCARRGTAAPARTWSSWRGRRPPGRTTSRPPTTCGRWARPTAAYDLLAPLVQWLLQRGRVLDARAVLADIGDPGSLHPSRAAWVRTFAGDAAVAYGDLAAALAAYRASLAIAERLAAADPSNAEWQRDLSVSHDKLGDVLVAQGQLADALAAYRASLAIASGWRRPIPATPPGSATSRSATTSSATCWWRQGQLADALARLPRGQPGHRRAAGGGRSEQRRMAARPVRLVRQTGQRPGAGGRPRGCGRALRTGTGNHRPTDRTRPEQRHLAE